eukprot:scaffold7613_cov59-Phaeocystis_antarctica.AAC.1
MHGAQLGTWVESVRQLGPSLGLIEERTSSRGAKLISQPKRPLESSRNLPCCARRALRAVLAAGLQPLRMRRALSWVILCSAVVSGTTSLSPPPSPLEHAESTQQAPESSSLPLAPEPLVSQHKSPAPGLADQLGGGSGPREYHGRVLAHGTACPGNPDFGCVGSGSGMYSHANCCTQCAKANGGTIGSYYCNSVQYHGTAGMEYNQERC